MMSQYLHESWGAEKGFPGGSVSTIVQTSDGYLWIGTDKGLIRFDGFTFHRFDQANPGSFAIGPVRTLMADSQGNLWVLLQNTKLFRYQNGTFELSRGEAENGITAMGPGTGGVLLLSSLALGTLTYDGQRFLTALSAPVYAHAASLPDGETPDRRSAGLSWSTGVMPDRLAAPTSAVISIAATTDGKIWLGTEDKGLYVQQGGAASAAKGSHDAKVNCLLPVEKSELWIGTSKGVLHWNGNGLTPAGVPLSLRDVEVFSMIRDRDSNIWLGTSRGLLRFNASGVSSLARESTSTGGTVSALLEDREGNIWIGSARGLERLRDSAFVTYSVAGLRSQSMGPVYADPEDQIWVAPIEGGLRWLKGGKGGSVRSAGLAHDIVYSITGSGTSDLWVGRQRGGLTHVHYVGGSTTEKTYTQADGLAQDAVYAVLESHDGTVWSGTLSAGVSELQNGHFTNYTTADGLASDSVSSIAEGTDGTLWFGTTSGLSERSKNGWRTYTVKDGLPSDEVNCLLHDSTGVLWIGTAVGLAAMKAGNTHVPRKAPDALRESIFGIAEDKNGNLWVTTASHLLQVTRRSLMDDVVKEGDYREYGLADGLRGTEGVKRHRSVAADSQGQLWFSTNGGLSMVNPARATANAAPALVHIEAISVDGNPLDLRGPVRVPGAKQRTTFRFVALSLSRPERVRYRYKLDGFDHAWSEAVTNREATYGNLGAGPYRFRVMASNGDGVWNGSEAAVGFEVQPTLWETWWFRLSCVTCAGLATLLVYRLRMHHLTRLLNVRFEERLAERTRVAQELHDTLLQGVLSASMQLHVAVDQLPEDSPARATTNRVLQLMGLVVEEGRHTLRGLRSSTDSAHDLEASLSRIPEELGSSQGVDFRVVVEGVSLPLSAAIRDEVYHLGREALVNAFRHSRANNIDVQLEYSANQLRMVVRDNGRGIDPEVLQFGRDGHWGLPGMRERAERMGARLRVLSRAGSGTEVELHVPADIAFESRPPRSAFRWFRNLRGRRRKGESSINPNVD